VSRPNRPVDAGVDGFGEERAHGAASIERVRPWGAVIEEVGDTRERLRTRMLDRDPTRRTTGFRPPSRSFRADENPGRAK
jgi:hypothetical protein